MIETILKIRPIGPRRKTLKEFEKSISGGDCPLATIRRRRWRVLNAVKRIERPIGSLAQERYLAMVLGYLRKDIIQADEGRRKWYVEQYGFSIPELTGFMERYILRMRVAAGGKNYETAWAALEQDRKARDVATLHQERLIRLANGRRGKK